MPGVTASVKVQTKTTMRYHLSLAGMAKIEKFDNTKCWREFVQLTVTSRLIIRIACLVFISVPGGVSKTLGIS